MDPTGSTASRPSCSASAPPFHAWAPLVQAQVASPLGREIRRRRLPRSLVVLRAEIAKEGIDPASPEGERLTRLVAAFISSVTILDLMERQGHSPEVVAADLAWAAASLVRTTQRELARTTPEPSKRWAGSRARAPRTRPSLDQPTTVPPTTQRGEHDEHHRPRQRRASGRGDLGPPGLGHWELDLSHCLGSMTPIMQDVQGTGATNGMRELFTLYGMPADTLDARFVNGYFYTRIRPLLAPDRPAKKAPPAFLLKLAFKVHPELRRRAKQAERTLADKPWRPAMRAWEDHERTAFETENLALQDIDLSSLDDAGLAAHVEETLAALRRGYHRHFILHGYDLGRSASSWWPASDGASTRPTWCRRCRVPPPRPRSRPACWPGCASRWRPAVPRRPRLTRSGPCRPSVGRGRPVPPLPRHAGVQPLRPRRRHPRRAARGGAFDDPPRREAQGTHDPEACAAALRERVPAPSGPASTTS